MKAGYYFSLVAPTQSLYQRATVAGNREAKDCMCDGKAFCLYKQHYCMLGQWFTDV